MHLLAPAMRGVQLFYTERRELPEGQILRSPLKVSPPPVAAFAPLMSICLRAYAPAIVARRTVSTRPLFYHFSIL